MSIAIHVSSLYYYPIKSCRDVQTASAQVTPRGLKDDRLLMVVDERNHFLTQREQPRLALVAPAVTDGLLTLSAPGVSPLTLMTGDAGPRVNVVIWRDTCLAVDQGDVVAGWLSDFLGTHCRLVRFADEYMRRVDSTFARRTDDQTGFADGFPFLLISQASLDDLNTRLDEPLPMNRFRPNIVVTGCAPYAEDDWADVDIEGVHFGVVKPCARCVTTTVDQATGMVGREPLRTLALYRQRNMPKQGAYFGQNLVSGESGVIRVGDEVRVRAVSNHPAATVV